MDDFQMDENFLKIRSVETKFLILIDLCTNCLPPLEHCQLEFISFGLKRFDTSFLPDFLIERNGVVAAQRFLGGFGLII